MRAQKGAKKTFQLMIARALSVERYLLTSTDHEQRTLKLFLQINENETFSKCHRSYQLFIMYCSVGRVYRLR